MAEARLSVRVDGDVKEQAELVFQRLGMTLSTGVNTFLSRVVMEQGIPFPLKLDTDVSRRQRATDLEQGAQTAVRQAVSAQERAETPVALYDAERSRPYLLYGDGSREYDL
jgi:DNA-damage-inducible protein J